MKGPLLGAAGAFLGVAAFAAGRWTADGPHPPAGAATADAAEVSRLERRVEELTRKLADERARRTSGEPAPGRARATQDSAEDDERAKVEGAPVPSSPAAPGDAPAKFSLEGITSAEEGSKRFMAFADAQLARGPEGYDAILEALGTLWTDKKAVEGLFGDEATATRHLYPWIRFLVEREGPVLDLSEHVFRNMAEKPEAFANVPDDDVLEIFAEGVGVLLPGAVPEDRLARFRGYATKFLETPEDEQPKALRGVRGDVERLLARFWAAPVTPEEALAKLRAGGVPPREISRLVRRIPKEALADLDVTALAEPLLREGNYDAFTVLSAIPGDRLDAARVDAALLAAVDAGKADGSFAAMCLQRSGRRQWSDVRAFFDRAFGMSDAAKGAATTMLTSFLPRNLRPERTYVEELLARGILNDAAATQLRAAYPVPK